MLVAVQGYPKIPGQPVGPALFPGLIAAGLCIAGVMLVARPYDDLKRFRDAAELLIAGLAAER